VRRRPHRPADSPPQRHQDRFSHPLAEYIYISSCVQVNYIHIYTRVGWSRIYSIRMCGPGQVYNNGRYEKTSMSSLVTASAVLQRNIDVSRLRVRIIIIIIITPPNVRFLFSGRATANRCVILYIYIYMIGPRVNAFRKGRLRVRSLRKNEKRWTAREKIGSLMPAAGERRPRDGGKKNCLGQLLNRSRNFWAPNVRRIAAAADVRLTM